MGLRVSRRNAFTSTFWMLIFLDKQDHSRERLAISFLNIFCVAVSIRRELALKIIPVSVRQRLLPREPCDNRGKGFQVLF